MKIATQVLLLICTYFLLSCTTQPLKFDDAKKIALEQQVILKDKVESDSKFVQCFVELFEKMELICEKKHAYSGEMVVKIQESGVIESSYYKGGGKTWKCMAEKIIGQRCEGPPISPLYAIFSVSIDY